MPSKGINRPFHWAGAIGIVAFVIMRPVDLPCTRDATEPLIEIQKFYRLMLFAWWSENGDMHLKNFSLLTDLDGIVRLTPAYDLVCTKLVIPDDTLAMPIGGRDKNFTRRMWLDFAQFCGIPERAAKRLISQQIEALEPALKLVTASFLPTAMKSEYAGFLRHNTAILVG